MLNESRFVQVMAKRLRLADGAAQHLGTWHMRATHELLRSAGVAPYGRSGGSRRTGSRSAASLQTVLVRWHLWNFLNGTFTWIRNRTIDVRAATLKRASTHGRPPGGRTAT
jgi:hypothetical protein